MDIIKVISKGSMFKLLFWKLGFYKNKLDFETPKNYKCSQVNGFDKNSDYALWVNHSTFYISFKGVGILTDPIWSKKCSLFGPARNHPPACQIEDLPKIDFVFISHNHFDHLNRISIKKIHALYPNAIFLVSRGVKKWFERRKIANVVEFSNWWDEKTFFCNGREIKVTATPGQHFSGRWFFDLNRTLWCGFVCEIDNKRFYFLGDSGYNEVYFKEIGEKLGPMDLSFIPIGAYAPRVFMSPIHMNPEEAVKTHKEVNSKFSLGMHWRTFKLSDESLYSPPYELEKILARSPQNFMAVEPGTYVNW